MKNLLFLLTLVTFSLVFTTTTFATGNVNSFIGLKILDSDDWGPAAADKQTEVGIMVDFSPTNNFPINFAFGLLGTSDTTIYYDGTGLEVDTRTYELSLGVRKYLTSQGSKFNPFVGGGFALISAEVDVTNTFTTVTDDDSGTGTGIWLDAGLMWTFKHFNIGFNVRYSDAEVTLFDVDKEVGGTHVGVIAGYHW